MAETDLPFTTWLKRRRRGMDLTQEELADRVGCALATLRKIESGERRPSKQIAELLAAALEVPPAEHAAFIAYARSVDAQSPPVLPTVVVAHQPLRSSRTSTATGPNNLPRQLTSFIGRAAEIADVRQRLLETCLLTLTGAGGCGKTRLALETAGDTLPNYHDGVWWVDLARLANPQLLPEAVAQALGLRPEAEQSTLDQLTAYLQHRQVHLLLDNCEHLITACATLADALLRAAPGLTILATSREPLGIAGEMLYRVPPLQMPRPEDRASMAALSQVEAVRLFVARAAAVQASFGLSVANAQEVAEICLRLDGMPLAIELAAARVQELPLPELSARLGDRFRVLTGGSRTALPRHQTLRATLEWSYGLLTEPERALLRRLAVFSGGWSLEAAEAVCGQSGLEGHVLDALSGLVDKSLVVLGWRGTGGRYGMLETTREYGLERLRASSEEAAVRASHAAYFLALAEQAELELFGPQQNIWLGRLEEEHSNLRAALAFLREQPDPESALRLAGACWRYWEVGGYVAEGLESLAALLRHAGPGVRAEVQAKALLGAGACGLLRKEPDTADWLSGSLHFYEALDDRAGMARVRYYQGLAAVYRAQFPEAFASYRASAALAKEIGDRQVLGQALSGQGMAFWWAGDPAAARPLLEQGLALSRLVDDKLGIALGVQVLAFVLFDLGEYEKTRAVAPEGIACCRQLGDRPRLCTSLMALGNARLKLGDAGRARPAFAEALTLARDLGQPMLIGLSFGSFAVLSAAEGHPARAIRQGSAAFRLVGGMGTVIPKGPRVWLEQELQAAGEKLGPVAAAEAWESGHTLPLDVLISEALADEAPEPATKELEPYAF